MEKILNQEEIDQLFRAAQGAASKGAVEEKRVITDCDFHQAGQLSKDQVRQLTLLHEAFAPNLTNSLGAYLRVGFQTSLASIEQLTYNEFLSRLPEQTYFAMVMLMPLEEVAAIQIDLSLVFPMIDLLLGGPGQGVAEPRDLTEIEEQILDSVVAVLCRELQATWQGALPLEFKVGQRMKPAQILSLMSPGERVLNLSFEIRLTDMRGSLNLIFPGVVSNMLLRKLSQQVMFQRRRPSPDDSALLRNRILDSEFAVELQLPHLRVSIRDVAELQPDKIVPLRHSLREPMLVSVNGRKVFSGIAVSCGPHRGGLIQGFAPAAEAAEKERI